MSERGSRQLDSQNRFLTLATTDGGGAIPIDFSLQSNPKRSKGEE